MVECLGDVAGHQDIDMVLHVILLECESTISGAGPIMHNLVLFTEDCTKEKLSIVMANILYTKIINNKTEREHV